MELETSQSLEQELNAAIESLQKELESEKEDESTRLKLSEQVHLGPGGIRTAECIHRREYSPYQ